MARILVATVPIAGHIQPLRPLVRALLARGHELLWYTGAKFRGSVESSGARFVGFKQATDFASGRKPSPGAIVNTMRSRARLHWWKSRQLARRRTPDRLDFTVKPSARWSFHERDVMPGTATEVAPRYDSIGVGYARVRREDPEPADASTLRQAIIS
jgi:UDP:flavonoid glycosyltransferase YjiC (YdhE family)